MKRAILLLVIGCSVGAAAALWRSHHDQATTHSMAGTPDATIVRHPAAENELPPSLAVRHNVYAAVVNENDAAELERRIFDAASMPDSPLRRLELEARLLRLLELEATRALHVLRTMPNIPRLPDAVLATWASADIDAALLTLSAAGDTTANHSIALAVLSELGHDEAGFARVLPLIPHDGQSSFQVDAIARLAAEDAYGAFVRSLAIEDVSTRAEALTRVARAWAWQDPQAAITLLDAVPDEPSRRHFHNALVAEWAQVDPDSALDHIRQTGWRHFSDFDNVAMAAIVAFRPAALLALVDGSAAGGAPRIGADDARIHVMTRAATELAAQDLQAAIAYVESLRDDPDHTPLLSAVVRVHAQQDPDAALAWARTFAATSSAQAVVAAIQGMASVAPGLAVDAVIDSITRGETDANDIPGLIGLLHSTGRIGEILDRILETSDQSGRPAAFQTMGIRRALSSWTGRDPDAATDWAVRNTERFGTNLLAQIAERIGASDPEAALTMAFSVPESVRGAWLASVLGQYESHGVHVLNMLAPFAGQPGYDEAAMIVAGNFAMTDPVAAARMIETLPGPLPERTVMQLAVGMASHDPPQAFEWAARLENPAMAARTIVAIAGTLAESDIERARAMIEAQIAEPELRRQAVGMLSQMGGPRPPALPPQ